MLELFGDKAAGARARASCGVPVLPAPRARSTLDEAQAFFALGRRRRDDDQGRRGRRRPRHARRSPRATSSTTHSSAAQSEARAAFGNGDVYVERLMPRARHIEVQIVGDGTATSAICGSANAASSGAIRRSSRSRRARRCADALREPIIDAARAAWREAVRYRSLGTFEFLVDAAGRDDALRVHRGQSAPAGRAHRHRRGHGHRSRQAADPTRGGRARSRSSACARATAPTPRGFAMQARINMETMTRRRRREARPAARSRRSSRRRDRACASIRSAMPATRTSPNFDSLLAKLIVHTASADFADVLAEARRALGEFAIEGVATNLGFLRALLRASGFRRQPGIHPLRRDITRPRSRAVPRRSRRRHCRGSDARATRAGRRAASTTRDPLAVLTHGKSETARDATRRSSRKRDVPDGSIALARADARHDHLDRCQRRRPAFARPAAARDGSDEDGARHRGAGQRNRAARQRSPRATRSSKVIRWSLSRTPTMRISRRGREAGGRSRPRPARTWPRCCDRHAIGLDAARPDAVARRRKTGQRTARENIDDLCDPGTFVEYGPLVVAAQRRRRTIRGPDREHAGRRDGRRHRQRQRRSVRRDASALRR